MDPCRYNPVSRAISSLNLMDPFTYNLTHGPLQVQPYGTFSAASCPSIHLSSPSWTLCRAVILMVHPLGFPSFHNPSQEFQYNPMMHVGGSEGLIPFPSLLPWPPWTFGTASVHPCNPPLSFAALHSRTSGRVLVSTHCPLSPLSNTLRIHTADPPST
jgi:hypothetical protein